MDTKAPTLFSYWNCLRDNPHYRNLWIADFVDNIGSWLSYVATLELVESFSGGSGLALSAVILIRFFPSLVLSPLAGVLADRCNRVIILVTAALVDAVIVAGLVAIHDPSQIPLLFILLTAQFSAYALQDPARRAILPVLVPESELHLATTLETFSWSLTAALGAAVGGAIASKLGNAACFLIDGLTYLVAAWFAFQVPRALGDPHAMEKSNMRGHSGGGGSAYSGDEEEEELTAEGHRKRGGKNHGGVIGPSPSPFIAAAAAAAVPPHSPSLDGGSLQPPSSSPLAISAAVVDTSGVSINQQGKKKPKSTSIELADIGGIHRSGKNHLSDASTIDSSSTREVLGGGGERQASAEENRNSTTNRISTDRLRHSTTLSREISLSAALPTTATTANKESTTPAPPLLAQAWASCRDGWLAAVEGWRFLLAPENRDVAALVTMKGCGSVTWGAVDVLNVKFAGKFPINDSATTLGFIFGTVGLACFSGPVIMNAFVPPTPRPLMWACATAFCFLFAGSVLMATARHLSMVLGATFVRGIGSATLWIYSTLLLQLRCPNAILGRVSAAEIALYTVAEALSSLYGGAAFDVFHFSLEETTASLAVAAGVVAAGWLVYAWVLQRRGDKIAMAGSPWCDDGSDSDGEEVPLQGGSGSSGLMV